MAGIWPRRNLPFSIKIKVISLSGRTLHRTSQSFWRYLGRLRSTVFQRLQYTYALSEQLRCIYPLIRSASICPTFIATPENTGGGGAQLRLGLLNSGFGVLKAPTERYKVTPMPGALKSSSYSILGSVGTWSVNLSRCCGLMARRSPGACWLACWVACWVACANHSLRSIETCTQLFNTTCCACIWIGSCVLDGISDVGSDSSS